MQSEVTEPLTDHRQAHKTVEHEGDNPKVPSKQEIKNTLKDTGYTKIHLEKVETQNTDTTKKNVDKDIKDNTDKKWRCSQRYRQ